MGRKESNQTNKTVIQVETSRIFKITLAAEYGIYETLSTQMCINDPLIFRSKISDILFYNNKIFKVCDSRKWYPKPTTNDCFARTFAQYVFGSLHCSSLIRVNSVFFNDQLYTEMHLNVCRRCKSSRYFQNKLIMAR